MALDRDGEVFEDLVELVLAGPRVKAIGVDEEVDVLGEAGDQVPALGEASPALEHHLLTELLRDDSQNLGDVVVLLDELLRDLEMRCGTQQRLGEFVVLEEPHFACQLVAKRRARRGPKSKRLSGLRLWRSRSSCAVGAPSSSPSAPRIARTRGGSSRAASASLAKLCGASSHCRRRRTVCSGERSLLRARSRSVSRIAPSSVERPARLGGRPVWTMELRRALGKAGAGVANSPRPGF